jgi:hypothetical protein
MRMIRLQRQSERRSVHELLLSPLMIDMSGERCSDALLRCLIVDIREVRNLKINSRYDAGDAAETSMKRSAPNLIIK